MHSYHDRPLRYTHEGDLQWRVETDDDLTPRLEATGTDAEDAWENIQAVMDAEEDRTREEKFKRRGARGGE